MKNIDSTYPIPIFISSTEYNLIDLRAELAEHLEGLGYKPILSTAEGFPDKSPELEPWESCLPVIDKCFVMVLIIDGRYGKTLKWTAYSDLTNNKKISPTHAEYLYAHVKRKRILVYVRRSVLEYYRSYRKVMKDCKGSLKKAKDILAPILPDTIEFESLRFLSEVKTNRPIPWIVDFDNVTEIKREIHKKMLNDLAEFYQVREFHHEIIIKKFIEMLEEYPEEKSKSILESIGYTKVLIDEIETLKADKISSIVQINEISGKLAKAQLELEQHKEDGNKKKALEKKIFELESEKLSYNNKIDNINKYISTTISSTPGYSYEAISNINPVTVYSNIEIGSIPRTCSFCKKVFTPILSIKDRECLHCHSEFCDRCVEKHPISGGHKCLICGQQFEHN